MVIQRKIKQVIGMGLLLLALTGCGIEQPELSPDEQKQEQSNLVDKQEEQPVIKEKLDIAMQQPLTLHPIYNMDKSVQQNLHLLFDTLVNIEEDGNITPNIAESWTYNPNDLTLDIMLRRDITWHDGQQLKSDDVIFSIQTIQKANESPYKQSVRNIGNVQPLGDYGVRIYYRQAFSGVMQTLFFPVIPEHVYNKPVADAMTQIPVGSGPYRYESQVGNKEMTFVANTNYFLGEPQIKQIEVMIAPDEESMLYAFEQSLIDVIYTDVMDWGKYAKDKSAKIHEMNTQYYEFMGVNFNHPLLQQDWLREALVYGIDRQELLDVYYLGHGVVTETPISPHAYLYDEQLEKRDYNKESAKLILAQQNCELDPETKLFVREGVPVTFSLMVNQENKQRMRIAEGIQEMYKAIGIGINIEAVSKEVYLERLYNKQFELCLGGWKLSYVPDLTFAFHSSQVSGGDNFISYKDSQMDALLQKAFTSSPTDMLNAYKELQQYIVKENPYISLYFRNAALITKKQIQGEMNPDPLNIYANIENWRID